MTLPLIWSAAARAAGTLANAPKPALAASVEGHKEGLALPSCGAVLAVDGDAGVTLGDDLRELRRFHVRHVRKSFGICQLFSKTPLFIGGGGGNRTRVLGRIASRDYMLVPGIIVGYGIAPELETRCLVRMK